MSPPATTQGSRSRCWLGPALGRRAGPWHSSLVLRPRARSWWRIWSWPEPPGPPSPVAATSARAATILSQTGPARPLFTGARLNYTRHIPAFLFYIVGRASRGEPSGQGDETMAAVETIRAPPWWKEPTKDQWYAYVAAWAGRTLDAFDFTAFLLIIAPIAKEFDVPVPEVAFVLTITLWMRLLGATANGWLADRIGRKTPLMISIVWYSVCNFVAGLAPSFFILFLARALLGIGMGAEWPAGGAGDGDLARALTRLHGCCHAGLVGDRVSVVQRALRLVLQRDRVAWPADDRHLAGLPGHLYPAVRQGARDLGRKSAPADIAETRSARAAVLDLQARHAGKHTDDLLHDGK